LKKTAGKDAKIKEKWGKKEGKNKNQ